MATFWQRRRRRRSSNNNNSTPITITIINSRISRNKRTAFLPPSASWLRRAARAEWPTRQPFPTRTLAPTWSSVICTRQKLGFQLDYITQLTNNTSSVNHLNWFASRKSNRKHNALFRGRNNDVGLSHQIWCWCYVLYSFVFGFLEKKRKFIFVFIISFGMEKIERFLICRIWAVNFFFSS